MTPLSEEFRKTIPSDIYGVIDRGNFPKYKEIEAWRDNGN